MIDHNSPEEVAKRANQEDPIVMYLIVRESLEMSIGKTAAQVGHAVQMLQLEFDRQDGFRLANWEFNKEIVELYQKWLDSSFRKVVLKADEKEWEKLKELYSEDNRVLVIDAGLTELAPSTETVIGLFPMKRSEAPKLVKRLQVLK
jgi:peptidyl-tRNA hydrolase